MKKRLYAGITVIALICSFSITNGQTTVFDGEIYWEWPIPQDYGGYSFYWWHRQESTVIINLGDMPADDWTYPDDYYNGEFTMRFEVISQPTDDPFMIQFGIWQDKYKGTAHPETVCGRQAISSSSVFEGSLGSPSEWWNKEPADHVDFSRPEDFYRIGIVLWNADPLCIPKGPEWGGGCYDLQGNFFPMQARVTITAYPGSGEPVINPPNYSVNYENERTSQVISSDDEYSYDNFGGGPVYEGDNSYLTLTPGEDVYFRKKADHSKKQTLTVNDRPATPSFDIDYMLEKTSDTVSSSYEYSIESDMGNAQSGTGSRVDLTPGQTIYFRQKATSSSFRSLVQSLPVPGRPATPDFEIDFFEERTVSVVGEEYEYSYSQEMDSIIPGENDYLPLEPEDTLYFRVKATSTAFSSDLQTLIVPGRPDTPAIEIDFINEETATAIGNEYIYASSISMADASPGDGSKIPVTPGSQLHIQQQASGSAFKSEIQSIYLPERPAAPVITIDYEAESTAEIITGGMEYSESVSFTTPVTGTGQKIDIHPGDVIYFREMATAEDFSSEVLELEAPLRPVLLNNGPDTIEVNPFLLEAVFFQSATELGTEDFTVMNASVSSVNLISHSGENTVYQMLINASGEVIVSLQLHANAVSEGNYQSELLEVHYKAPNASTEQTDDRGGGIRIYPNPTEGVLNLVAASATDEDIVLKVYSLTGNLVYSEQMNMQKPGLVNLGHLNNGVYVIKIRSESFHTTEKVLIQR